ncbi:MAG: flagellin [Methanoregula sp.]
MNSQRSNDLGFTGLEAAIVLIAFVVVAAVFSYVVLGAGFFTTQKAQETVHTSVQQASSTLEIVGNVYGTGSTASVSYINFTMALAPGGTPVDFGRVILTYSNATVLETLNQTGGTYPREPTGAGYWAVHKINNDVGTGNRLLETGEQFEISAEPTNPIYPNDKFTLEIKPGVGAALGITRSVPGGLNQVNILY